MKKIFLLAMVGILLAACSVPTVDTTKLSQEIPAYKHRVSITDEIDLATGNAIYDAIAARLTLEDPTVANDALKDISATTLQTMFVDATVAPTTAYVTISYDVTLEETYTYTNDAGVEITETRTATQEEKEEFSVALAFVQNTAPVFPIIDAEDDSVTNTPEIATYNIDVTAAELTYRKPVTAEADPANPNFKTTITAVTVEKVAVAYTKYEEVTNPMYASTEFITATPTFSGTIAEFETLHKVVSERNENAYYVFPAQEMPITEVVKYAIRAKDGLWGEVKDAGTPATAETLDGTTLTLSLGFEEDTKDTVFYYTDRTEGNIRIRGLVADSKYSDTTFANVDDYMGLEYKIWIIK